MQIEINTLYYLIGILVFLVGLILRAFKGAFTLGNKLDRLSSKLEDLIKIIDVVTHKLDGHSEEIKELEIRVSKIETRCEVKHHE